MELLCQILTDKLSFVVYVGLFPSGVSKNFLRNVFAYNPYGFRFLIIYF